MKDSVKVKIVPLSINRAWQGKKFKTYDYKKYEEYLLYMLPKSLIEPIPEGKLEIHYIFGLSSKLADYDNPIKPLQDILQKKYNFDDKRIYKSIIEKIDVTKGNEFFEFKISSYIENEIFPQLDELK